MRIQFSQIGRMKQGKTILKNYWQIAKGDKWILYGLNGAGKATLLNILNAYDLQHLELLTFSVKCQAR